MADVCEHCQGIHVGAPFDCRVSTPRPPCQHFKFVANVDVNRISEEEGGKVTRHMAEVRINCDSCGQAFRFLGLPLGVNLLGATMSANGLQARLGLEAATPTNHPLAANHPEGAIQ